jgi:endonuclease/exonuclease/phosphatase family metal-dependent hydrolase
VRLATFNILHGRSPTDGRVDLDRFRAAVASLDADVLALQEVDRRQERSHQADLTAIAADAMGAEEHRFVPALRGAPEAWAPAEDGDPADPADPAEYGVALLSRRRVSSWQSVRLPRLRSPALIWSREEARPRWVREEPRVAVVAVVDGPSGPVTVANTHLSFVPWWNGHQLRALMRSLRQHAPWPRLLLGDLNMGPRRARRVTGMASLVSSSTFPADAPREQLDHVLADGSLVTHRAEARWLPLSDHRALVVEIG